MKNPRHFSLAVLPPERIRIVRYGPVNVNSGWGAGFEWWDKITGKLLDSVPPDENRNYDDFYHGVFPERRNFPGVPPHVDIFSWSCSGTEIHVNCRPTTNNGTSRITFTLQDRWGRNEESAAF